MNISIRHMQHFVFVAETLHFRRAAELANVTQPALSRSVQTIEAELGFELLTRNNRNVKLTAAGKEFLEGSKAIIGTVQSTIESATQADAAAQGTLRIGYSFSTMVGVVPELVNKFQHANPDIDIRLHREASATLLDALCHEELDFCFHACLDNSVLAPQLGSTLIEQNVMSVIVNSQHRLANGESISITELDEETIILPKHSVGSSIHRLIKKHCYQAGINPSINLVVQDPLSVLGQVAFGRGVTLVTGNCVTSGDLKSLKLTDAAITIPTRMTHQKLPANELNARFLKFIMANIQEPEQSHAISVASDQPVQQNLHSNPNHDAAGLGKAKANV